MSYSAQISFKSIPANNVQSFFQKYKSFILQHIEDIAKQEAFWLPYIRENFDIDRKINYYKLRDKDRYMAEKCDFWISRLFQYRVYYIDALELLAVYGVPDCCQELFDGTVYFQNSCDQDYERKYWEGIKPFEEIYDKWDATDIDADIVKKEYEVDDPDVEYYKRTRAYDEIWGYLENSLYNDDEALYVSLIGYYDMYLRNKFFDFCIKYCDINTV